MLGRFTEYAENAEHAPRLFAERAEDASWLFRRGRCSAAAASAAAPRARHAAGRERAAPSALCSIPRWSRAPSLAIVSMRPAVAPRRDGFMYGTARRPPPAALAAPADVCASTQPFAGFQQGSRRVPAVFTQVSSRVPAGFQQGFIRVPIRVDEYDDHDEEGDDDADERWANPSSD
eukprot:gene17497-biopygen9843